MYIVFEGPDHSGKTTQIDLLRPKFKDMLWTKEPGSPLLSSNLDIRKTLLNPNSKISSAAEAHLYAADRIEHMNFIKENLEQNKKVCSDRNILSSLVYQGYAGDSNLFVEDILNINKQSLEIATPDIVFYFQLPYKEYIIRKKQQEKLDRIEQKDEKFFKEVIEGYDELTSNLKLLTELKYSKIITIDATKKKSVIHNTILKEINDLIKNKK